LGTKNNISRQITTEGLPHLTANQLKAIFKANPVPIYIWQRIEKDFKLIGYNEPALSITNGKIKNYLEIKASKLYQDIPDIFNELTKCYKEKITLERDMPYLYISTRKKKHLSVRYFYIPPDLVMVITKDISESQLTEAALKESENKYQAFIEKTQDGILITQDNPVQIVFASPAMAEITGYSIEELKSLKPHAIKQLIHPEDFKSFTHNYIKLLSKNQPALHLEFRGIKKNSSQIWLSISFSKITYGDKPCVLAIFKDITEPQRTKKQLAEINKCLISFGSDSNENINKLTAVCGELMGGFCALYNRMDKGLLCSIGKWHTPPDFNPADKPEDCICYDVIKEGSDQLWVVRNLPQTTYVKTDPNVIKYKLMTYIGRAVKRGKEAVGAICVVFQKDYVPSYSDRELLGIIASALGVEEERLQAYKALQDSRETARALLNSSSAIEMLVKPDTTILLANEAAAASLGKSVNKLTGTSAADILQPEVRNRRGSLFNKVIQTGKSVRFEDQRKEIWFDTTFYPILDENRKVDRVAIYALDITERKRAHEEKVKLLKQLAKAEKLTTLGQAASTVVHEINNPLDIISTKLYLLEKSMAVNDENLLLLEHVNKIKQQVFRLGYLANTILTYARPPSTIFKTIDINNILQQAIDSLSDQLTETVELKINMEKKIISINGDAIGLEIVFKNLILNALEARKKQIKIIISTKLYDQNIAEITIKDNGVGIKQKDLDNIFKTFFTTKRESGGTGLGLAISRKIIEQHNNGTINIESKLNEGTKVSIHFPISQ